MSLFGNYIKYLGNKVDQDIEDKVSKYLPKGKNKVYLDCGCDDGTKTLSRGKTIGTKHIIGLETEPTRAKRAAKNGVKVKVADLNKIWPIESGRVDCITATEVVEHLIDEDNFFAEAYRVLRKKGRIIISTDNLSAYHNIFALIVGNQPYTGPYLSKVYPIGHRPHAKFYQGNMNKTMYPHLNVMTSRALDQLLTFYGFKVRKMLGAGFYPFPPPLSELLSMIDKRHASHCIAIAEK